MPVREGGPARDACWASERVSKQTKNEVARRGVDRKEMQKNHFKVFSREEKLLISFSSLSMKPVRCMHVRDNCGFAYAGQGQIMDLSQISGHELGSEFLA